MKTTSNPEQDMLNQMMSNEYDLDDHEAAIMQDMGRMMDADILGITFDDEDEEYEERFATITAQKQSSNSVQDWKP